MKEQILPAKPDKLIIETLLNIKISSHWFLDANYSDEFEDLIKELKTSENLDELVSKNLNKIFYEEEKLSWVKKLKMAAFIKYSIGKDDESSMILGLTQDENLMNELFENILKRSIYEYLMTIKYNKDQNTEQFTIDEIDSKIKYIEEKWVQNV